MTLHPSPDLLGAKAAQRRLVQACGGGEGAAASLTAATGRHVRQQRMSECGNVAHDAELRVSEVIALERVAHRDAGWPHVTRTLALAQGFALVALPDAPAGAADWLGGAGVLARHAGDLTHEITTALAADGRVDASEWTSIRPKVLAAAENLMALLALGDGEAAA